MYIGAKASVGLSRVLALIVSACRGCFWGPPRLRGNNKINKDRCDCVCAQAVLLFSSVFLYGSISCSTHNLTLV